MDISIDEQHFLGLLKDKNALPRALAGFMFREIIEDACVKYGISEEDKKEMCQNALDRAAAIVGVLDCIDPIQPLTLLNYYPEYRDAPDEAQVNRFMDMLSEAEKEFHEICGRIIKAKLDP